MAVTTDQLLVNVSVNTGKASKNLGTLTKEVKGLRGEFNSTSDATKAASKALTDFGFANVKINASLETVKKSIEMVKKALNLAFGPKFIQDIGNEFEYLGRQISSALSEGLQIDSGEAILGTLKDINEGFKNLRPTIVDAMSSVKSFSVAVKEGLIAIDWDVILDGVKGLGLALAIAFSPAILAAVAAFGKSMVIASTPIILLAGKIAILTLGLADVS